MILLKGYGLVKRHVRQRHSRGKDWKYGIVELRLGSMVTSLNCST